MVVDGIGMYINRIEINILNFSFSQKKNLKMVSIYVLALAHGKYYVGKSTNVHERIKYHFSGRGCVWTRIHKPYKVIKVVKNCDNFDEDKYTKIYMKEYGIDNVRGGSYCQIEIDDLTKDFLRKEILSSSDSCFYCEERGHYIQKCPNIKRFIEETHVDINNLEDNHIEDNHIEDNNNDLDFESESQSQPSIFRGFIQFIENNGNGTHPTNQTSEEIGVILKCHRCRRDGHTRNNCYAKTDNNGAKVKLDHCFRCGRNDHWSSQCRQIRDVDGTYIGKNDDCTII